MHSSAILPHLIEEGSNYENLTQTCTQQVNPAKPKFDELIPPPGGMDPAPPSWWFLTRSVTEDIEGGDDNIQGINHEVSAAQRRLGPF